MEGWSDGWRKGRGEGRRRGDVIEEPRPEEEKLNIRRGMN